jgi:hypothetical protein
MTVCLDTARIGGSPVRACDGARPAASSGTSTFARRGRRRARRIPISAAVAAAVLSAALAVIGVARSWPIVQMAAGAATLGAVVVAVGTAVLESVVRDRW